VIAAAFGPLEWAFTIFVATMTGLAGVFGLYVLIQNFRNPSRR
jgi:hypothetical protein